jgi:hypothetical protein
MLHKHHRTDANDSEIVAVLRKLGAEVVDLSQVGRGVPDKLVYYKKRFHLIEIKHKGPCGWKHTPSQKKFMEKHTMPVVTIDSVDGLLEWAEKASRAAFPGVDIDKIHKEK